MKTIPTDPHHPANLPIMAEKASAMRASRYGSRRRWKLPGGAGGGVPIAEAALVDADIYVPQWEGLVPGGGTPAEVFQVSGMGPNATAQVASYGTDYLLQTFPVKVFALGAYLLPSPLSGLYVVDYAQGTLGKYAGIADIPAAPTQVWSGFSQPHDVVMDGAGNLYVSDSGHDQIVQLPLHGGGRGTWGGVKYPCGLAFSNGSLYIADTGNNRIVQIPHVAANFPPPPGGWQASNVASLDMPSSVAVDGAGNIYIIDGIVEMLGLDENPSRPQFPTATFGARLSQMRDIQGAGWTPSANTMALFNGPPVALAWGLNGLYASGAFQSNSGQYASIALLPVSAVENFAALADASQTQFQTSPRAQVAGPLGIYVDQALVWEPLT